MHGSQRLSCEWPRLEGAGSRWGHLEKDLPAAFELLDGGMDVLEVEHGGNRDEQGSARHQRRGLTDDGQHLHRIVVMAEEEPTDRRALDYQRQFADRYWLPGRRRLGDERTAVRQQVEQAGPGGATHRVDSERDPGSADLLPSVFDGCRIV